MEVIDIQGKVVKTILLKDSNVTFDISEKGIYAIRVNTENGTALLGKIVVQ